MRLTHSSGGAPAAAMQQLHLNSPATDHSNGCINRRGEVGVDLSVKFLVKFLAKFPVLHFVLVLARPVRGARIVYDKICRELC